MPKLSPGYFRESHRRLSALVISALLVGAVGAPYVAQPNSVLAGAGAASALNFQPEPNSSYAAGAPITVGVQAVDANGQKVTSWSGIVCLATNPSVTIYGVPYLNYSGGKNQFHVWIDTAGSYTFTATECDSNQLPLSPASSTSFTIVGGPPSAATSTITASPTTIGVLGNAGGVDTSAITVTTYDQYGNLVTTGGATVTLSTTLGSLTSVTDNGNGTYTATLTSTTTGTATITGTLNGTPMSSSATVNVVQFAEVCSPGTNCDGSVNNPNQGLFGDLNTSGTSQTQQWYLTLALDGGSPDLQSGYKDCGITPSTQLVGTEANLQVFGSAPNNMQTTQVMIFPKAYLQSIGYSSRNADQFNVCLGAIYLPNPLATDSSQLSYPGSSYTGTWYGVNPSTGAQQSAANAPDSTGQSRWWATVADCSATFIRPGYDPCVGLKTKNGNQVQSYLQGLNWTASAIDAVTSFMGPGDLAIVLQKPYPWDGRVGYF